MSMIFESGNMMHALAVALLHSLWQGGLVYGAMRLMLKVMGKHDASVRYTISFVGLMTVALWFGATLMANYDNRDEWAQASGAVRELASARTWQVLSSGGVGVDVLHMLEPYWLLLYCVGFVVMAMRLLLGAAGVLRLRYSGTTMAPAEWRQYVQYWVEELGINRVVAVRASTHVTVPMVVGYMRPVILLPVSLVAQMPLVQVESVLLHELAHIRRHDYLHNVLQSVIETVLFINPFVWMISHTVRKERELCCDDVVMANTDGNAYAHALASLEENRQQQVALAMAATGNGYYLLNRIKRIMEMKDNNKNYRKSSVVLAGVAAALFLGAVVAITPSVAQQVNNKQKTSKQVVTSKVVTVDSNGKRKVVTKTTTTGSDVPAKEEEEEQLNVSLSVRDDEQGHTRAKVQVSTTDKETGRQKTSRKEVVIASAHEVSEDIERELDRILAELGNAKVDGKTLKRKVEEVLAEVEQEMGAEWDRSKTRAELHKALERSREELEAAKKEMHRKRSELRKERNGAVDYRAEADRAAAQRKADERAYEADKRQARAEAEQAEAEAKEAAGDLKVNRMLDQMEREGLIDRKRKYRVEKDGDMLFINGEKAKSSVAKKYLPMMQGNEVLIKGSAQTMSISVRD